jgi:hypothetical protein
MLAAMGDGSIQTLSRGMAPEIYWGMVTPKGREPVSIDF